MQFTDIFRGKTVDVSKRSVTVEVTGTDDKIEAFEEMVRPFGLIEMVRTGEIAVSARPRRDLAVRRTAVAARPCSRSPRRAPNPFALEAARDGAARGARHAADRPRAPRPSARARGGDRAARAPSSTCRPPCSPRARPDDRFFCLEQPDRERLRARGAGQSRGLVEARGPGRFARSRCARVTWAGARSPTTPRHDPRARAAPGPVFVGGFAFAPEGGRTPGVGARCRPARWCCPRSRSPATAARRA